MTPQYPHLLPVFLIEAEHCLAELAAAIAKLAENIDDEAAWHTASRAAHTLKGNAAMMAFSEIHETAFTAEVRAQAGTARPQHRLAVELTASLMLLRDQVDELVTNVPAPKRDISNVESA